MRRGFDGDEAARQSTINWHRKKTGAFCIGESEVYLQSITVNVALYGALAQCLGKRYVAAEVISLSAGATIADLLKHLSISDPERGYLFINAVLCDVPGLTAGNGQMLKEKDHVGIFSIDHMWPYQYRDGVRMSEALQEAMQIHGAMHHTYQQNPSSANPTQPLEIKK